MASKPYSTRRVCKHMNYFLQPGKLFFAKAKINSRRHNYTDFIRNKHYFCTFTGDDGTYAWENKDHFSSPRHKLKCYQRSEIMLQ